MVAVACNISIITEKQNFKAPLLRLYCDILRNGISAVTRLYLSSYLPSFLDFYIRKKILEFLVSLTMLPGFVKMASLPKEYLDAC